MEWKETESFDNVPKAAESLESQEGQTEEREPYGPEDVVRIYIQVDQKENMQEIVDRISEEALEGEELEVHSLRAEAGILTGNVRYEQISKIREVAGVVSVELAGKGALSQTEESEAGRPAQTAGTESLQKELGKPAENTSFFWWMGGAVFLFLMAAVWGVRGKQKRNRWKREDKKE